MPWFKVDDKLHDHRKARAAGKAAIGVWTLAGSWSRDNRTNGFIPEGIISRWGDRRDAGRLVSAGLWVVAELDGEKGWRFHDWAQFQPDATTKESEAGVRGNHRRWHVGRGLTDPDCEYCYRVPDQEPNQVPDDEPDQGPDRVSSGDYRSGANRPKPIPNTSKSASADLHVRSTELEVIHYDFDDLCGHLANRIEGNTGKRPVITERWRTDARLLLDRDDRDTGEAHRLIDWATNDTFWRSNILSMPKFREKYDQLRLQAQRPTNGHKRNDIDWDSAYAQAAATDEAEGNHA